MVFDYIKIQNFLSFGNDEQKLYLRRPGLFLVLGYNEQTGSSNGAGKSTIFDAICFAVFGRIPKDLTLPQIVNETNNANTRIELAFEINGTNYWIVRFQKHAKYDNNLLLYKNKRTKENLISKANKTDTQEIINDLIKFNYKSFINAVMMSQENVTGFLQDNSQKKKDIIENILQLTIISKHHYVAQLKRKQTKKQLMILDSEVRNTERLIKSVKTSMADYASSCKRQKEANKEKIKEYTEKLKELETLNIQEELDKIKEAEHLAQEKENGMILYQQYVDKIASFDHERETYKNSLLEYKGLISSNKDLISIAEKEIKQIENKIKTTENKIKETKENPEQCPVCKNNINEKELNIYIEENKLKLEEYKDTYNDRLKHFDNLNKQIEDWKEKEEDLKHLIDKIKIKINKEQNKADEVEKNYESIEIPKIKNEKELKKLFENKQKMMQTISELEGKKVVDIEYLKTLTLQAKNLSEELKTQKLENKKLKRKFIIQQWWEDSFSSKKRSMKSWCINNMIGYFNAKVKHYMDRFFDGFVSIQLDNELNEKITFIKNKRDFKQFSGGEKRRLNLAILFALNSLVKANISTKINIMFLDEILSTNLDDKGISVLLELLEEMKQSKETVYIIDHKDNFKDYPSFEPIMIKKDKKGFSNIKIL